MLREKGKIDIREVIRNRDSRLYEKLQNIWNKVYTDEENIHFLHSIAVEQNISSLIPDQWKFDRLNPLELFSLSASSCLHDIDKGWGVNKKRHGEMSAGEIRFHFNKYGLDAGQADLVGWIIKVHDHGDFDFDLPEDPVVVGSVELRIRPLAALFKLADLLHADYRRVDNPKTISPKDRARFCIRGWKFDAEGRIKFFADPDEVSDIEHIHRAIAMMRKDLEKIAPILRESGYPYQITIAEIDESKLIYAIQSEKASDRSFLGMDSFSEDDQHLFKGRSNESQELYQMLLTDDPIIALVGESGIGKTSLVKAGLFPILRRSGWKIAYIRVLHNNIADIIQCMWFQIMESNFPSSKDGLVEILQSISEQNQHDNILILFDQFEDALKFECVLNQIKEALYHVQAMRFQNIKVLLCYRSDYEGKIGPILQDIAYSLKSIPRFYLRSLDRKGAEEAILMGMKAAQIGFDPDFGAKNFIELILNDIEKQDKGFYPPYIQMVGETLKDRALSINLGIIHKSDYDSLNGVSGIISNYLFKQIDQFGDQRQYVEKILMELTSAVKCENSRLRTRDIDDLIREVDLEPEELDDLLYEMSCKWMIRHLGSGKYELIHDQLAEQVYENLIVARKELEFKLIREHISAVANIYPIAGVILDTLIMAKIYSDRNRINPTFSEKSILLHSCIAKKGPAWFWFRNSDSAEYQSILYAGLSHPLIRMDTIKILSYTKDESIVPELLKLGKESEEILCTVIETLGIIGSQESIPMLIEKLDDNSVFVRVASAKALSKLGAKEAKPKLMKMIKGEGQNVQKIALLAYSRLADQEDITFLREMLNSIDLDFKSTSIRTLARLLKEQFISELDTMLKDKNRHIRISAIDALICIVKENQRECPSNQFLISTAKSKLYSMLQDRSKEVRIIAFRALMEFFSWEDIPLLMSAIESDVPDIKVLSAESLARLGYQEGFTKLRAMLKDGGRSRRLALKSLSNLGDPTIIPDLIRMIEDEDPIVRKESAHAIGILGSETEIQMLLDILFSSHGTNLDANNALIYIDRKLYCPFRWDT